nr:MAG TPA: hypothetical protein [Caudoviricetes sp.]
MCQSLNNSETFCSCCFFQSWPWAVEVRDQELLMRPFSPISIAKNNHFFAHAKQS